MWNKLLIVPISIHIDDDERRAGDCIPGTPALRNALHKRCLARAEITLQADHIACLQCSAQTHAEAGAFVRGCG